MRPDREKVVLPLMPLLLLLTLLGTPTAAAIASGRGGSGSSDDSDAQSALKATLDAMEAAVDYVGRHVDAVNLDGVIGLRTVEGQTDALLARYWTRLPEWLVSRLTGLRARATAVSRRAADSVKRRTPRYFANAGRMIDEHFWDTFYPARPLPPPRRSSGPAAAGDFDEKFSDDCIHEFYGQDSEQRCALSLRCWRVLVQSEGMTAYSLTHQLFYLMNGIQANCLANLTAMASAHPPAGTDGSLAAIFDSICARVFGEALKLEADGFPTSDRDLFMEQIGLCGLAGYTQTAQWRWLPLILRWQRPSGCYGQFQGELVDPRNFESGRYGNERRKRAEARMGASGCLSHRTSVAMDALMAFCRRLVERLALGGSARGR